MKHSICVVVTARPSYSRIRTALQAMHSHPQLEPRLVLGSSALLDRYGDITATATRDGFAPVARVHNVIEGESLLTMPKTTGLALIELATVFENLRPSMVLTIADRYETLATAVAASYMNIPLVHVQGGEVTGSIDEKVRHAVTKLSDLHLVATERARENVIRMGEDPELVVLTGCPSIDIAAKVRADRGAGFDPVEKYRGVGGTVRHSEPYIVVLQHPVTTEHERARQHVTETLMAVHELGVPAYWFWPNVDAGSDGTSKGIRDFREHHHHARIHYFKNMLPEDFLRLVLNSQCIVGNSSVAVRECSFLGVPAVNVGTRQEGREYGRNLMSAPTERAEIKRAIKAQLGHGHYEPDALYGDGDAGPRIAEAISQWRPTFEKKLTYARLANELAP